ncbi:MAG: hypothetical protein ACI8UO_006203 [Verrucomicrobiales bacterium]|jgi:hypothetical protein
MSIPGSQWWAKTDEDGEPALSVEQHLLNVGTVAEELIARLGERVSGGAVCAASHDVGKISLSFASLCQSWLDQAPEGAARAAAELAQMGRMGHGTISAIALDRYFESSRKLA